MVTVVVAVTVVVVVEEFVQNLGLGLGFGERENNVSDPGIELSVRVRVMNVFQGSNSVMVRG